jgi:hypothetical protein
MQSTAATSALATLASVAALGLIPAALAHGDEHAEMGEPSQPLPEAQYAPTYFAHPDHRGTILAHIALMVIAWVFLLPVGKPPETSPFTVSAQTVGPNTNCPKLSCCPWRVRGTH